MLNSDYLIKAITKDGAFRVVAASTKYLTEEARKRHNLSHTATVALGRTFACGILLCNTLRKTKGHLILKIKGNGSLGAVCADVSNEGTVRGYVGNPQIEEFDDKGYTSIQKAIGSSGYLHVTYDNQKGIPYSGSVELTSGEIANDVVHYLAISEQIFSYVSCGVYLEPETGEVLHSGGIIIQRMPEAKEEDIKTLENTVARLDPFSLLLRAGLSIEDIAIKSLANFELDFLSEFEGLCFYCSCSKEKFEKALIALGKNEIKTIIEKIGYAEGRCHYCNNTYLIKKEDLEELIEDIS